MKKTLTLLLLVIPSVLLGQTNTLKRTQIGSTTYDIQSNASPSNRIIAYPDGKISAVWTYSADDTSFFQDRGTGFNHFNGSTWGALPTLRAENKRTGFPCLLATSTNEIIISHAVPYATSLSKNPSIGGTTWTNGLAGNNKAGALWPAAANSGNNLYILNSSSDLQYKDSLSGVIAPIFYSRSINMGTSFVDDHITLPGYDSTRYLDGGGEEYSIDASGNTVAIVIGGFGKDITLWKSADAGVTFTKIAVQLFPIPAYDNIKKTDVNNDGTADTIKSTKGGIKCLIDHNNNVHVFWAEQFNYAMMDSAGTPSNVLKKANAIRHWDESSKKITLAGYAPDLNNNGKLDIASKTYSSNILYLLGGNAMQPSVGIDQKGDLYLAYTGTNESDSLVEGINFRDIFLTKSSDNGATWSIPLNVSNNDGKYNKDEDAFPSIARYVNDSICLIWQSDANPGTEAGTPQEINDYNKILFSKIPSSLKLSTGVMNALSAPVSVKVYPNPSNGKITIKAGIASGEPVQISIWNVLGEKIMEENFVSDTAGLEKIISLTNQKAGIYLLKLQSSNISLAERIVLY